MKGPVSVTARLGLVLALSVVVAGCADDPEPTAPIMASGSRAAQPATERLHGLDRKHAELAQRIPGFGGVYFDEDGVPVIQLVDTAVAATARAVLATEFSARGRSVASMRTAKVQYGFTDLARWRTLSPELMAEKDVISIGISERSNRIRIGVADLGYSEAVVQKAVELGIPRGAIEVVQAKEPISYADLRTSKIRPVPGGMQVTLYSPGSGECTLGYNAYRYGDANMGFVTASHCSGSRGTVDYTDYYQPNTTSSAEHIGVEIVDPPLLTGGICPAGYSCRYSDVLFATYYNASGQLGALARTTQRSSGPSGSLTIDAAQPRIMVANSVEYPYEGEVLDKIGRTTGWTTGVVFESCTDIKSGSIVFWCQDKVDAGGWYGDSGAPVFYYLPNLPGGQASLVGILWGGPGDPNDITEFWMSSNSGIGADGILISRVK